MTSFWSEPFKVAAPMPSRRIWRWTGEDRTVLTSEIEPETWRSGDGGGFALGREQGGHVDSGDPGPPVLAPSLAP